MPTLKYARKALDRWSGSVYIGLLGGAPVAACHPLKHQVTLSRRNAECVRGGVGDTGAGPRATER